MAPTVVLAGYLVRYPLGGYAWQALHFLAGFRALGCDVFFYEDSAYYADAYVPGATAMTTDYTYGVGFTEAFFARHGFGDAWAFWDAGRDRMAGARAPRVRDTLAAADLIVNLGGVNRIPPAARRRGRAAYVDLDPGYTQIRLATGDRKLAALVAEHDAHFTLGERIGTPGCRVPDGGLRWQPLRQPVPAELWQPLPAEPDAAFTTIGQWDATGRDVTFGGERFYWRKRLEWMRFLELPARTGAHFRIAMDVARRSDDLARLEGAGWEVIDPLEVSRDPEAYRDFIRRSRGEFTVAKDVNVRLRSGWFSDRAACYLAAGRPVVNQDTGFDVALPTGAGLFAFRNVEEAAAACRTILTDEEAARRAARALAERQLAPAVALAALRALAG